MKLRLILLGTTWIAASCGGGPAPQPPGKEKGGESDPPIMVRTVEVRVSGDGGFLEIPATIESRRRAVLGSRLSASIIEFGPREGDRVSEGAVLVRLEDQDLSAALSAAQVSEQAAARDLARAESLFAKDAATRNEVENAFTATARARSALVAARKNLSEASVRAPFAGRITRKIANVGDTVSPGQALLEVEGEGGLEVNASIEGSLRERLQIGQRIDVRVDGVVPPVAAVIHTLAPSADPSTHRFTLRADLRSAPGVRAGLFARIDFPSRTNERRLLVPADAVLRRGGLTGVYVVRDGHAWLRWIAPGDAIGDSLEIRAGLEDQERVALEPSRLEDGAAVREVRP